MYYGPTRDGQKAFFVVTDAHKLLIPVIVAPSSTNDQAVVDALTELLDALNPERTMFVLQAPRVIS